MINSMLYFLGYIFFRGGKESLLNEKLRIEKALSNVSISEEEKEKTESILCKISELEEERTIETESLALLNQQIEKLKLDAELKRINIESILAKIKLYRSSISEIEISGRKAIVNNFFLDNDYFGSYSHKAHGDKPVPAQEIRACRSSDEIQRIQSSRPFQIANVSNARSSGKIYHYKFISFVISFFSRFI
jgi:hypothetical protein